MSDPVDPVDPVDPFEARLSADLEALVAGERAPYDLADRAARRSTFGGRLGGRRTSLAVAAGAVAAGALLFVAIGAIADGPDDVRGVHTASGQPGSGSGDDLADGGPSSTSTSTTRPAGASDVDDAGVVGPDGSTTTTDPDSPTTSTSSPPASGTTLVGGGPAPEPKCFERTGEVEPVREDWATQWKAKPKSNQPATVRACIDDMTPRVGQLITITLEGSDPDATIGKGTCDAYVRWENEPVLCRDVSLAAPPEPVPTPVPEPGHVKVTFTHAYEVGGPVDINAGVISSVDDAQQHPYESWAYVIINLHVDP